ncbi:MAG: aminoglycoside phosphotransferase [Nitrosomonadales bacterium]|nr:MAG: aminoglycoside phosphotransferase [Nitrosomonadales bacterium]
MSENSQSALIRALLDPARYDYPVASVELIETHISWVLLTGSYAYKIKKAVNLGFLDFSTLEKRRFYCQEELRLNRRFSPQLYQCVTPIAGTPQQPALNGGGTAIEYAVKMREFPQEALLDRMLESGLLGPAEVDEIACEVARFHAMIAGVPAPAGFGTPAAVQQPVLENFAQIAERGRAGGEIMAALESWSKAEFTRRRGDLAARKENNYIRECHGDLHLGNMAWIDGAVTLFDCIEFNPNLRWIDVMSDAAFVIMDLHDRGRPDLAQRFLNSYLEQSGDFGGLCILNYYLVYRAMVRAKVAVIRGCQQGLDEQQKLLAWEQEQSHLELASRFTRPSRPWLMITHGYSGSGKTTATQYLVEHSSAIRVRSDVERKRLFGLAPHERSQSGLRSGIYSPDAHMQTYRHLEQVAREILQAGYPAIVDAAFLKQAERQAFQALSDALQVPFIILHLHADEATLRQRIAGRQELGKDASEATLKVLELQLQGSDELTREEAASAWMLDTGHPEAASAALQNLARQLMDNPDKICQD